MARPRAGWPRERGSFLSKNLIYLSLRHRVSLWDQIKWIKGTYSLGLRRPECEANCSFYLLRGLRMRCTVPQIPYAFMALCVKCRDSFPFLLWKHSEIIWNWEEEGKKRAEQVGRERELLVEVLSDTKSARNWGVISNRMKLEVYVARMQLIR